MNYRRSMILFGIAFSGFVILGHFQACRSPLSGQVSAETNSSSHDQGDPDVPATPNKSSLFSLSNALNLRLFGLTEVVGSFFLIGSAETTGVSSSRNFMVARYSVDQGSMAWAIQFGGNSIDTLYAGANTANQGLFVVGSTRSQYYGSTANEDMFFAIISPTGSIVTAKNSGAGNTDSLFHVTNSPQGGFVAVGRTETSSGVFDALIAKFSDTGAVEWMQTWSAPQSDEFRYVAAATDGYIAVGSTTSFSASQIDATITKYDFNGNILWARMMGGSGNDSFRSATVLTNGDIIAVGSTDSVGAGLNDGLIAHFSSTGQVKYSKVVGGISADVIHNVRSFSNNRVVMTGATSSFGQGAGDVLLAQYNYQTGTVSMLQTLGGTDDDVGLSGTLINRSNGGLALGYYSNQLSTNIIQLSIAHTDRADATLDTASCSRIRSAQPLVADTGWSGAVISPSSSRVSLPITDFNMSTSSLALQKNQMCSM